MKKSHNCRHFIVFAIGLAVAMAALGASGALAQTSCGPFVESSEQLLNGDFLLGISYFGALAIDQQQTDYVEEDLDFFKSRGINSVRVWANWTLGNAPNASVLNANGSLRTTQMSRLRDLIDEAEQRSMTVDVTFSWRSFGTDTCTTDCQLGGQNDICWNNFQTGLENVARSLKDNNPPRNTNIFYDVANEYFFEPDIPGCPEPGPADVLKLADAVRLGDPGAVLVTASGGREGAGNNEFAALLDNGTATFVAPHFARDDDWALSTGQRIDDVRDDIFPRTSPIHLQENNRRNDTALGASLVPLCDLHCQEVDFLNATAQASQYGAAGWVFHTDAGFRLDQGRFRDPDNLDMIETGTLECDDSSRKAGIIDCLAEQLTVSRCIAPPLVEATFEGDPAGGSGAQSDDLRVHLTERGGMDWLNDDDNLGIVVEGAGHMLTSQGGPENPTLGSFQYNLPSTYDGTLTLEASVGAGNGSKISFGFADQADTALETVGEAWVSFDGSNGAVLLHGRNGLIAGEPGCLSCDHTSYHAVGIVIDLATEEVWLDTGTMSGPYALGFTPDPAHVTVQIDDPVENITRLDDLRVTRD
jgi:hypothetical protein